MSVTDVSSGDDAIATWPSSVYTTLGNGRPAQYPAYVISYNSTTTNYEARNGITGAITSGTNAATVIQGCIDALTSGGIIQLKENTTYNIGSTQLTLSSQHRLRGHGRSSLILYGGASDAVRFGDGTSTIYDVECSHLSIGGGATTNSLLRINRCYHGIFVDVGLRDATTGTGLILDGTGNYTGFLTFINLVTSNNPAGVMLTGTAGARSNLNTFIGGHIYGQAGPPAGSIGVNINLGDNNHFYGMEVDLFETGFRVAHDANTISALIENCTTGLTYTSAADNNDFRVFCAGCGTNTSIAGTNNYGKTNGAFDPVRTLTVPFSEGTASTSQGFLIEANLEYARSYFSLPSYVQSVPAIRVYAMSVVLEGDAMAAVINSIGAADNETYNTHEYIGTNVNSTSTAFDANDIIYWTITDADITALSGGDSVMVEVLHEAGIGANCDTNAWLRSIEVDYT